MTVNATNHETPNATLRAPEQAVAKLKDEVTSGATEAVDAVKHAAGEAATAAKKAAETQISAGKNLAVENLGYVAQALRQTGGHLSASDSPMGDYVTSAATRVDQVSSYLQTRTLSELITDVEGYAKREPAIFLGGAFVLGLFGGRFLKSSAPAVARSANGSGAGNETTMRALPAYGRPSPVPYSVGQASEDIAHSRTNTQPTGTTPAPRESQTSNRKSDDTMSQGAGGFASPVGHGMNHTTAAKDTSAAKPVAAESSTSTTGGNVS